jgi:putative endonuclease
LHPAFGDQPVRSFADLKRWVAWRFPPKTLGQRGEAAAARFAKRLGYKIVAQGERGGLGELDLVAVDGKTIVFIEVKTRRSHDRGHPAEAVGREKQRRLTRLALGYLKRHGLLEYPARFDVIAVTWPSDQKRPQIEHIIGAFEPEGRGRMFA